MGRTIRSLSSSSSSSVSGTIEALDEGISLGQISGINGIGEDIKIIKDGNIANIYVPSPNFSSHFNENDGINNCLVNDISSQNRYVATGSYISSGIDLNNTHFCIKENLNYICNNFSIEDLSSIFTVSVLDRDNLTTLAEHQVNLNNNYNQILDGISITVFEFMEEDYKYKASIEIDILINMIIPDGGFFYIKIDHFNNGIHYEKTQGILFYDPEIYGASMGDVILSEETPVLKHLSGIKYYDMGSLFGVLVEDLDNINSNSYPLIQLELRGNNFGLENLNVTKNDLTNWLNIYNHTGALYSNQLWELTRGNYCDIITSQSITAQLIDWEKLLLINSNNFSALVNTRANISTRVSESFDEESWRCSLSGDFDLPNQKSWDSSSLLSDSDVLFYDGGCEHNQFNWSTYNPIGNPNYSLNRSGEQILIREFQHDGSASAGFQLNILGTYNSLEYKLAKPWDGTASGGTDWITNEDYDAGSWNNGKPVSGGGKIGSNSYTFGTNNIINTNNTLYIKIKFNIGQRIEALDVLFQ